MPHSFVVYIDESGDDGLVKFRKPGGDGGSSNWLAITACVVRASRDLDVVAWRDEILSGLPVTKRRDIHFKNMNHSQRTMAAKILSSKQLRLSHVISDKSTIPDGIYREKDQLYFYLTRHLIERVSWLCRDLRPKVPEGDGRAKIVFSRRGKMSYSAFRDYLSRLKIGNDTSVHWPVIDIEGIEAQDHSRRAGLQLADIGASSFAAALEMDKYGNCEPRYAEILKSKVYHRRGNYLSYGLKLLPSLDQLDLTQEQLRLIQIFK